VPDETMGMAMMDGMGQDCCHDMKSPTEHGKPCKPGQECKTGGMLQVSIIKPPVTLSSPLVLSFSSDSHPLSKPIRGMATAPHLIPVPH
jgi:hypothetical protein